MILHKYYLAICIAGYWIWEGDFFACQYYKYGGIIKGLRTGYQFCVDS